MVSKVICLFSDAVLYNAKRLIRRSR